ncbi:NAD(P)/FAD-dependent oxidoreductase [Streptomyces sp. NPDC088725]|uniref:NAD(P)/FAD-dependent oxidoreductase n=1 Tax=Streptomyces sp. NPDC088725 TaxID=3365873 RepID=UPI00381D836B
MSHAQHPERIVVVGASAAGLSTAEALRRGGFAGTLTLVGDEVHPPYDRPPLSKQLLSGAWESERLHLRSTDQLTGLDLELRLGVTAVGLDQDRREVSLSDGSVLGYDALVIATGVRARRLPGTDGLPGVHALRTMDDALALRGSMRPGARLAIVGAGFIGAEAAAVASGTGCQVTLISDLPQPLSDILGPELGAMLTRTHTDHGVRVETGVLATGIPTRDGRACGVELSDGRTVDADLVLVGIGTVPNTEWLRDSGLPLGNGVECDAYLRAGEGIWAAGDVASWPDAVAGLRRRIEHRTNAAEQGLAVARNILAGEAATPFTSVPYVWSDQYDLKIQMYGLPRGAEHVRIVEGSVEDRALIALYGSESVVQGVVAINMARAARGYRRHVAEGSSWPLTPA